MVVSLDLLKLIEFFKDFNYSMSVPNERVLESSEIQ